MFIVYFLIIKSLNSFINSLILSLFINSTPIFFTCYIVASRQYLINFFSTLLSH